MLQVLVLVVLVLLILLIVLVLYLLLLASDVIMPLRDETSKRWWVTSSCHKWMKPASVGERRHHAIKG
jgi:hypothetical protein